jgi:hypothetical protein
VVELVDEYVPDLLVRQRREELDVVEHHDLFVRLVVGDRSRRATAAGSSKNSGRK